jgi:hypothetical protein
MSFTVFVRRVANRRMETTRVMDELELILPRKNGWKIKKSQPEESEIDGKTVYQSKLVFTKYSGHMSKADIQWQQILTMIARKAESSNKWEVLNTTQETSLAKLLPAGLKEKKIEVPEEARDYFKELKMEPEKHFDHIYDRDAQILIVRSAIETAIKTEMRKRFNCVLYGDPGCGKTEILLSVGRMLGEEGKAYLKFDATSTTEAGAQRLLLEAETIPPVLIVEEIEKADEKSFRWLLGIGDERGEIRKTSFKGHKQKDAKMLILATVNNMALFENLMSGALASRFPNKIYCDRPDRTVMQQILTREVTAIKGNPEWIEPTLKFGMDRLGWNDPRKLIPICLQGRERLLNDTYQAALLKTLHPNERKKYEEKK